MADECHASVIDKSAGDISVDPFHFIWQREALGIFFASASRDWDFVRWGIDLHASPVSLIYIELFLGSIQVEFAIWNPWRKKGVTDG